MPKEESMYTMGFWKLLQNSFIFILRLFVRLALCFFAALLTTLVLARIIPGTWKVPVRIVEYIVRVYFPSIVMNIEIATDIEVTDFIVFYGGIAFLCYLFLSYKIQKR